MLAFGIIIIKTGIEVILKKEKFKNNKNYYQLDSNNKNQFFTKGTSFNFPEKRFIYSCY